MITNPIIEIDCHGMLVDQAIRKIEYTVHTAPAGTYRVRVIHGFNSGTRIKDAILREFGYGLEPKVKRIAPGDNQGITDLILREY